MAGMNTATTDKTVATTMRGKAARRDHLAPVPGKRGYPTTNLAQHAINIHMQSYAIIVQSYAINVQSI